MCEEMEYFLTVFYVYGESGLCVVMEVFSRHYNCQEKGLKMKKTV